MITFEFSETTELLDFIHMVMGFLYDEYSTLKGNYGILIENHSVTLYDVNELQEEVCSEYKPRHARILNE